MIRRAFVRRMIFAGLATWFLDLPLPVSGEKRASVAAGTADGWVDVSFRDAHGREASMCLDRSRLYDLEVGKSYTLLDWPEVRGGRAPERMPGMVCVGIVESSVDGTSRAAAAA